jgi:hypothetical protein
VLKFNYLRTFFLRKNGICITTVRCFSFFFLCVYGYWPISLIRAQMYFMRLSIKRLFSNFYDNKFGSNISIYLIFALMNSWTFRETYVRSIPVGFHDFTFINIVPIKPSTKKTQMLCKCILDIFFLHNIWSIYCWVLVQSNSVKT